MSYSFWRPQTLAPGALAPTPYTPLVTAIGRKLAVISTPHKLQS